MLSRSIFIWSRTYIFSIFFNISECNQTVNMRTITQHNKIELFFCCMKYFYVCLLIRGCWFRIYPQFFSSSSSFWDTATTSILSLFTSTLVYYTWFTHLFCCFVVCSKTIYKWEQWVHVHTVVSCVPVCLRFAVDDVYKQCKISKRSFSVCTIAQRK